MHYSIASVDSLIINFSKEISLETSSKIKYYFDVLKTWEGIIEVIPSYTTIYIQYDLFTYDFETLVDKINQLGYIDQTKNTVINHIRIPVFYDMEVGLDLKRMSEAKNLSVKEIIQIHTSIQYRVHAIGFAPGFAYLGEVDSKIAMPRLSTPRKSVPKGAVAIADTQTAVYPQNSPGGWNIIGRTPFEMFDYSLKTLCPVQMGDTIEFYAICKEEYLNLGGEL